MTDWTMFHDWMLATLRNRSPICDVAAQLTYGREVWPIGPAVAAEIERLTGLLDGRTVSCSQCNAAAEREATLRALLTDVKRVVWLEPAAPPQLSGELALLARIDAALDGGVAT